MKLRSAVRLAGRWLAGGVVAETATLAGRLVQAADDARDALRFGDAGVLYEQVLELAPGRADLHVQAGHMFKETRDYARAERHYRTALRLRPEDADLALQLGHFYKVTDRPDDALREYRRAAALAPDWIEPKNELAAYRTQEDGAAPEATSAHAGEIVAELLPGEPVTDADQPLDRIVLRRLGSRRTEAAVRLPLLWGVEAIRGVCWSSRGYDQAELSIDGQTILREGIQRFPTDRAGIEKAVFNLWVDLSTIPPGPRRLELVLADPKGETCRTIQPIQILAPASEADFPDSDAVISTDPADLRDLTTQIRSRPSMVRPAHRQIIPSHPAAILLLRTDQLGDMVISIPALRRLRQVFPDAHIVMLVTQANADLARTVGLVDEVIPIDFPHDDEHRKRVMTTAQQTVLQHRLAPYRFDLAIDLSVSHMSRPLLKLSGAKFQFGFDDASWPWLDAGLAGATYDPKNSLEVGATSGRVLALIERLATLADNGARVLRREELGVGRLARHGLGGGRRFVVLHGGARIPFSRWAGYGALASALLARHDLDVVLLEEDTAPLPLSEGLEADPRFRRMRERLPFDDFDALLSHAALFVGNDSGPKHLAALRGTPVVSLHSARINWSEWGQEQTGLIISRRVPCAGCAIYHEVEECGKGFACIADIHVDEVLAAAERLLAAG